MAAISINNPTLRDLAAATDPNGQIAQVVEILNLQNEILEDMTWVEGNLTTGNKTAIRSGLPPVAFRKMYGGVQPNKSGRVTVTDNCGMLEAYAEVDKALADLAGNAAAFRLSEDKAFIESMNQSVSTNLFYGSEVVTPEGFTGLSPRFSLSTAPNGENVIKADGAGTDNASIWLVLWSPETVHGVVPKGSHAGLQVTDKGVVTIENADGAGGRMEAYRTHFRWDVGLTVKDWRYVVRICNVDKSNLKVDRSSGADLPDLMYQALEQIPNLGSGRPAFYMSRSIRSMLRRQIAYGVRGSTLEMGDVGGKMIPVFQGVPLRRADALSADEALVS
jgi:hypothetical protein